MIKEISDVIVLVEDRISEILESGDLKYQVGYDAYPTDKYIDAVEKHTFLKGLLTDLTKFDIGRY